MENTEQLRSNLRTFGLHKHEEKILRLVRPCVRLSRRPIPMDQLQPLDSRLGGEPHLPRGFDWPFWNGIPLGHIATIRLSEASRFDMSGLLPRSGLMYFWYDIARQEWGFDPAHTGFMRVDYVADERTPLVRTPMPKERIDASADRGFLDDTGLEPCRVVFQPRLSLPNAEWIDEFLPGDPLAEIDEYDSIVEELITSPKHHLLGHPSPCQGPMELECQLVTHGVYCGDATGRDSPRTKALEPGSRDWRLLLQVDTDEEGPGWMWGDMGMLYYWIPEPALRRADFSKSWLILQCG